MRTTTSGYSWGFLSEKVEHHTRNFVNVVCRRCNPWLILCFIFSNCLFRAVSDQIIRRQSAHIFLRVCAASFIQQHRHFYRDFSTRSVDTESNVQNTIFFIYGKAYLPNII